MDCTTEEIVFLFNDERIISMMDGMSGKLQST